MVYEQKLGDFVLDFDYKLTKGCNSGVFLRVSDLKNPINTGIEVALDETRRGDERDSGGFYSLVAPRVFAQKPAGTWNHMTITAAGPRIAVVLNDTEVSTINLDEWTIPGKRPDGTDHNFKNVAIASLARSGYLGVQNMGGDCWFKNVILNKPARSVVPVLGDTVADTSPPAAKTPARKAPAPGTPAPAAPAPKPAAPTTPAPSPRWVILGEGNHFFARNIPDEAYKTLGDLEKERAPLKSITFAPGGGWVILHGRNGYFARNIPDEAYKTLGELAKRGEELKSITFAPGGGWTILFGLSGNLSRNIPDEAFKMLASLSKRGAELKSIAFAPGGGWTILHSRNGHVARNIPDEAFKTLGDLARRGEDLKSITFVPGGGWTILFGPSGYFARNIPDEAFKTLGTVGSQGDLKSLSFMPGALIRLSQDDQETRNQVLERMAQLKVPGLSIALVNRFQVEWARGYGTVPPAVPSPSRHGRVFRRPRSASLSLPWQPSGWCSRASWIWTRP